MGSIGMNRGLTRWSHAAAALLFAVNIASADDQAELQITTDSSDASLVFDWPAIRVGSASYEAGPTGVTVFHFPERAHVAMDIRGGGPGTVNAPYVELGYDIQELDTIVFAGGSWYGLEAVTAVASALKDDGIRDGNAFGAEPNIAMSLGSIIFDFGSRRLNEIYPDKRLAQAAFRAAEPGRFQLGAAGAGRSAMTGYFFGCNARSGQGGAFLQRGDLKIAAFTVVNAFGALADRGGRVAACHPHPTWPKELLLTDLMRGIPESRTADWNSASAKNTTISLLVVNQRMSAVQLKRLAVQVHMSMGRAIQPFATFGDGDVLYAVSTAEVDEQPMLDADVGVLASELMWDAILASVPPQIEALDPIGISLDRSVLASYVGDYAFSSYASLRITADNERLFAQAIGERAVFSIGKDHPVEIFAVNEHEFMVPGRYPMSLRFTDSGTVVVNPGSWEQTGLRQ